MTPTHSFLSPRRALSRGLGLALAGLLAVAAGGAPTLAHAQAAQAQSVSASVTVIVGSNGGSGVDPSLASLSGQLGSQFPQFDSFSRAGQQSVSLAVGVPQTVRLPGGGEAVIELESSSGGTHRIKVNIPGGGTTITTSGGRVFVGGAAVQGGTLILAIDT